MRHNKKQLTASLWYLFFNLFSTQHNCPGPTALPGFDYNIQRVYDSFQTFNKLLIGYLSSFLALWDWRGLWRQRWIWKHVVPRATLQSGVPSFYCRISWDYRPYWSKKMENLSVKTIWCVSDGEHHSLHWLKLYRFLTNEKWRFKSFEPMGLLYPNLSVPDGSKQSFAKRGEKDLFHVETEVKGSREFMLTRWTC